jgi:hypothetical protein
VTATVVSVQLTVEGNVADFGESDRLALADAMAETLGCIAPVCLIELRLVSGSVVAEATFTIPETTTSATAAVAIDDAARALVSKTPAKIASDLAARGAPTITVTLATSAVQAGVTVAIAVAPPPSPTGGAGPLVGAIMGTLVVAGACVLLGIYYLRRKGKRASATVAALPVAALPAAPQPAHVRVGMDRGSNEGTAKADKGPPPPTEHVVADSVFSIVAGPRADSISIAALSKWLIQRGDTPLDKIQALFNAMDTDGNGSIDRQEWRVGFTAGLV